MAATAVRTKCSSSPARTGQKTSAGNGWALGAAGARSTDTNGHFEPKSNSILRSAFGPLRSFSCHGASRTAASPEANPSRSYQFRILLADAARPNRHINARFNAAAQVEAMAAVLL